MKKTSILFAASLMGSQIMLAQAAQNELEQARTLLHNNQPQSAYDLLLPLEDELAGQPQYDLLFGNAALLSGHKTRSIMAFERCLAVMPNNGDCRIGLAQSHIQLQEHQSAKRELQTIQSYAPPPEVASVVQQYLDLIEAGQTPSVSSDPKRLQAWLDVSFGYDDNVNAGPRQRSINLPLGLTLDTKKDDTSFGKTELGLAYQAPINNHWYLIGGANLETTNNFNTETNSPFKSILQGGGYLGTRAFYGRQRVDLIAQGQNYQLRGHTYRNLYGAMAQYSYLAAADTQLSLFYQNSHLRYRQSQFDDPKLSNVQANVFGASMVKSLLANRLITYGGFYLGKDSKTHSQAADFVSSDYFGIRGGATWFFQDKWHAGVRLQAEQREYGQEQTLFFNGYREDDLYNAQFNLAYQLTPKLQLHSEYSHTHNSSNSKTREYKRNIVSMGVRYDFF